MLAALRDVESQAAALWGVELTDLRGRVQRYRVTAPRHAVMWVARNRLGMRIGAIANALNRDRATVLYGCRQTTERKRRDPEFAARLGVLEALAETWGGGKGAGQCKATT